MAVKKSPRKAQAETKPASNTTGSARFPKLGRPAMPKVYGIPKTLKGSVSWEWAVERLTKSHNYLLTTVRPDGWPHTMIVWGIWLDNAYYFSTGASTRKAKNLAGNPHCVVCNENVEEAVIVEGEAHPIDVKNVPPAAFGTYDKKYGWKLDPKMGPIFQVKPRVIFAMPEKLFPAGATRWRFD